MYTHNTTSVNSFSNILPTHFQIFCQLWGFLNKRFIYEAISHTENAYRKIITNFQKAFRIILYMHGRLSYHICCFSGYLHGEVMRKCDELQKNASNSSLDIALFFVTITQYCVCQADCPEYKAEKSCSFNLNWIKGSWLMYSSDNIENPQQVF